jgi:HK97 gp10 family phage protein
MAGRTGVTIVVRSNRLPQMPALIKAAVVQEVTKATLDVEAKSKALAPVRTGTLRRSIHSVFEAGGLRGIVGPSVLYGKFVELGTRRMGARPYMRPAAEQVLPKFADAVKRALAGLH